MQRWVALLLVLPLVASGCLSGGESAGERTDATGCPDEVQNQTACPPTSSSSYSRPRPSLPTNGTTAPRPPSNQTPPKVPQKPWPLPEEASIRPGVQLQMTIDGEGFQCTSNFVFTSPDNATLYLGTAAHCVDGLALGDTVRITGATKPGKVAYSAWIALGLDCNSTAAGTGCTGDDFENDFALIEVDPADRDRVSPAVLHFGGPTALMDSADLDVGDRVLVYGNSGLWFGVENLHRHEGVVSEDQGDGVKFYQYTVAPGIQGDSGSGVLTRDGRAAGILVTLSSVPPGESGVTGLKSQLELASAHGMPVELATWDQLDDGIVP